MTLAGNEHPKTPSESVEYHEDGNSNEEISSSVSDDETEEQEEQDSTTTNNNDANGQEPIGTESPVVVSPAGSPSSTGQNKLEKDEPNGSNNSANNDLFWDANEGKGEKSPTTNNSKLSLLSSTMMVLQKKKFEPITPNIPPFWKAGLHRKASAKSLQPWAALSLTLDGRDKITKILQYVARFLGWYLSGRGRSPEQQRALQGIGGIGIGIDHLSKRFISLYKSLATSRKAFRLGRSLVEAQKLSTMGLGGLLIWHLKSFLKEYGDDDDDNEQENTNKKDKKTKSTKKPEILVRHASSNIGWGPRTLVEDERERQPTTTEQRVPASPSPRRPLYRSLSSMAYRRMFKPSEELDDSPPPKTELWKAVGTAIKMIGLFGFWTGDNVNFLSASGFLDNYDVSDKERLHQRGTLQSLASRRANQAYFMGSLAGFFVAWKSYWMYQWDTLQPARIAYREAATTKEEEDDETKKVTLLQTIKKLQEKEITLFLALLKSCCDIIVFSNNPGIDLHKKWRGKKNHEGFHCLCGLISAGTVLYNNFPEAK